MAGMTDFYFLPTSFMDEIFRRMNAAIKVKKLDPMDLKLLPSSKVPRGRQRTKNKNRRKGANNKKKNKVGTR